MVQRSELDVFVPSCAPTLLIICSATRRSSCGRVIQRVYFKLTHGKRIFRMTPIHHAFEMRGWKEVKIDFFFSLIAIIGVVLGLMYVYMA